MTTISSTPRRPSTAQPLHTRMPYEAGEALLWERQNHRAHTHLAAQLKDLQAQHAAFQSRILATEAVAEAAETAVHQVKQLEAKVRAVEEEDRDRPFDAWVKEAVAQLQVAVDGLKGVRGRISGVEMKVDGLVEEVEAVGGEKGLLRSVVGRLEVLEGQRRARSDGGRQPEVVDGDVHEACDDVLVDDNPLAVFYGIDTQSPERPTRRQDTTWENGHAENNNAYEQGRAASKSTQSPHRRCGLTGDLQPPDEDTALPEVFDALDTPPQINYGWENTQQFKDMQKELNELRAMCRSQDPKSSNNTADATQRPQETLIIPKENNVGFSDATTEAEAESNDADRSLSRTEAPQGQWDVPSLSDNTLPSSPPKRTATQSARRRLMKRPSIYNPRVPSVNEHGQNSTGAEPVQTCRTPLLDKLPVDALAGNDKVSAKRKRVEDAPAQRVTRPKLSNDKVAARKSAVSTTRKTKVNEEHKLTEAVPSAAGDGGLAHSSPTRRTYSTQKSAKKSSAQEAAPAPAASASGPDRDTVAAAKPSVPAAETVKSRKAVSKPKPSTKKPTRQPAQTSPSSSKPPAAVKKESKVSRQPGPACKSCRARHQKCDRVHPACGRCAKGGLACKFSSASDSVTTASPKKKQALLPMKKSANEVDDEDVLRGRSVAVSPEAPRHQTSAKSPVPASLPKKPAVAAAPTAASSRAPRAKNTQNSKMSPQKKQK